MGTFLALEGGSILLFLDLKLTVALGHFMLIISISKVVSCHVSSSCNPDMPKES